jgi:hypothetical protein
MGKTQEQVVEGCADWASWWIDQREAKLQHLLSETMSINPLMAPLIFELHGLESGTDLVSMLVTSHLMIGHSTGFGKLIDEKILPGVFDATKLDAEFRKSTVPYSLSCFDDVDHQIIRPNGQVELISLKSSTWTIQLASAVQLNRAFSEINADHRSSVDSICLGVFVGKDDKLSDKYDIARGINRGANHDVVDLTDFVSVRAGRKFWSWLNEDQPETQDWVLEGFLKAAKESNIRNRAKVLLEGYIKAVGKSYPALGENLEGESFKKLLKHISD